MRVAISPLQPIFQPFGSFLMVVGFAYRFATRIRLIGRGGRCDDEDMVESELYKLDLIM